ncbi:MAG: hypothetical protein HY074_13490 [Deltaproteobacteria bacterium]|nr:hypothetical protein [Deltaproteobacteria bacterium]
MMTKSRFLSVPPFSTLALAALLGLAAASSGRADDSVKGALGSEIAKQSTAELVAYRGIYAGLATAACSREAVNTILLAVLDAPGSFYLQFDNRSVSHQTLNRMPIRMKIPETLKNESSACRDDLTKMLLADAELQARVTRAKTSIIKIVENIDPKTLRASSSDAQVPAPDGKTGAE